MLSPYLFPGLCWRSDRPGQGPCCRRRVGEAERQINERATMDGVPEGINRTRLPAKLAIAAPGSYTASDNIPPAAVPAGVQHVHNNKEKMLDTFGQYWRRAISGINRTLGRDPGLRPQLAQLEQQILTLTSNTQTLDSKLEHIHAEEARQRAELLRRIDRLDQTCQENNISRATDATRLSECEQRIAGMETEVSQGRETVAALETSMLETTHRLETRNQQIKFLQDSAREQLQAFKTELAETRSRLETRDNETNNRLDEAHALFQSLETSLADAFGRIETADQEIITIQHKVKEQRLQVEGFLDSATVQLEVANNHAALLEKRVQTDGELREKQFQQIKLQLQHQQSRLLKAVIAGAGGLVLLLVTVLILR
jgi:chromosome segregation ATPase